MKIVMIYDQIQSGAGIKDDHLVPLGLNKGAVGPAIMMEPYLKKVDGDVLACLHSGDGFYNENKEEVSRKLCAMITKLKADVVICGPCFDYKGYAQMAAEVAVIINQKLQIPAIVSMAEECEDIIINYKEKVHIVKMPRKGAPGLNRALEGICELTHAMFKKENEETIARKYCY